MCLSSRCGAVVIVLLATWILRVVIHTSAKEADPIDITHCQVEQSEGDFRRFASAIHQVACDV